jgi:cytochrome c551/c552
MKRINLSVALLLFLLLLAACGRAEGHAEPATPNASTPAATNSTASTTSQPISQTNPTRNASADDLPPTLAALLPNADPSHGRELTVQYGCTACHALEDGVKLVGPSWYNIGTVAANRVPNESAARYLYHSITDPNQHVVDGFLPNLMPQTYAEQLSEQELADLIQYLRTLQE